MPNATKNWTNSSLPFCAPSFCASSSSGNLVSFAQVCYRLDEKNLLVSLSIIITTVGYTLSSKSLPLLLLLLLVSLIADAVAAAHNKLTLNSVVIKL